MVERRELSSRQFRDLREQIDTAVYRCHTLPRQHALLSVTGERPRLVRVWDMAAAPVSDEAVADYRNAIMHGPWYSTAEEVDAAIEERRRQLLTTTRPKSKKPKGNVNPALAGSNGHAAPETVVERFMKRAMCVDVSDECDLRNYLTDVKQLTASSRREVLQRLADRSTRPRSYYERLLKSVNGART
jgi:hypothetical protein